MKDRTILQTITDTLEAAGISVSGIDTWPPEEDGRVSVSMTIRPRLEPETKTDIYAFLDAINADEAPDDPPAVRDPCRECADPDCFSCSLKDGTPIKLYDPKEAAAAMMAGRVLQNKKGEKCFWENDGFRFEARTGQRFVLADFSGLYEEAKYV
jgi:hypothetical protein